MAKKKTAKKHDVFVRSEVIEKLLESRRRGLMADVDDEIAEYADELRSMTETELANHYNDLREVGQGFV